MLQIENFISRYPGKTFAILLLLAIPAFFINLGLLPLFADEPTRANVALEMILSGNYSVPTIGGEYYYNKPPVYNWILAISYLSNDLSEFTTRLPAILPLFLFACTIFLSVNYFLKDKRVALLGAMLSMVNGRMLIYDSMLGHIDIFYSWLTLISFMAVFYFYQKQKWFLLFFTSYVITAVTFLCKGMPSILFQGFTILALLIYFRQISKLFCWQHIFSGFICLLLIGSYFYNYSLYNSNLEGYLKTIWDQSSQRTAATTGILQSIKHVLLFPFEYAGHLFPASLFILFCFNSSFWKNLRSNSFLSYCGIVFCANIWVYWLSPETRPRYLLMLFPLLFIIWSHAYYTYRYHMPKLNKLFERFLLAISILVILAMPAALFYVLNVSVSYMFLKSLIVILLFAIFTFLIYKSKEHKIVFFIGFLLILRLGFSWFVLPQRLKDDEGNYFRQVSTEMGKISRTNLFYFYQYHPQVEAIPFHHKLIFYIQRARMKQVKFTELDTLRGYYLTFDRDLKNPEARLLKTYSGNLKFYEVK